MQRDATWRELLSSRLPREEIDVIRLYRELLIGLDTPVSLGVYLRLKYIGLSAVHEMRVQPVHYLDRIAYLDDVQAVKFLAKYPSIRIPGLDPRQAALDTLERCEAACEVQNQFWEAYEAGMIDLEPEFESLVFRVRDIITEILGEFSVQEWLDCCRFGPGTTAFAEVPKPSDAHKLVTDPTVTDGFYPYARAFLAEYPGWNDALTLGGEIPLKLRVVSGGKHASVPKKATTDRNIETQPTVNLFAQLGLGLMIRRRLKTVAGIDLDRGQDKNREFARLGSIHNCYATEDLSNASDTICRMLPLMLVEDEQWRQALCITRTSTITFSGGSAKRLHRFSAMGNGFTFELESLIFYAIARACTPRGVVLVYGDDIIVPTGSAGHTSRALELFGFTINEDKSYAAGPFRESCGADWFLGQIARPFQLESEVTNVPAVISLANGLARAACRSNRGYGFDRRYRRAWLLAYSWIPHRIRSKLAWGNPQGDEFLFVWKFRGDRFVVTQSESRAITSYYQGRATALYRVYARRLKNDDPSVTKAVVRIRKDTSTYTFVPGNPMYQHLTWGPNLPLGVDRLVHTIGWC